MDDSFDKEKIDTEMKTKSKGRSYVSKRGIVSLQHASTSAYIHPLAHRAAASKNKGSETVWPAPCI